MSIALLTEVWKMQALTGTQKLVLLALADYANDQGECYPSISMLAEKCSLSDRGVQKTVNELIEMGHVEREMRNGRSTVYSVHPRTTFTPTPEPRSPQPPNHVHPRTTFTPNDVHPAPEHDSPLGVNVVHPTPEPRSPITINEPSIEPPINQNKKDSTRKRDVGFSLPEWVPVEAWEAYVEMRTKIRKPMTDYAKRQAIGTLEKLKSQGHSTEAILNASTFHSWQGLFAPKGEPQPAAKRSVHGGFEKIDYSAGINPDGSF